MILKNATDFAAINADRQAHVPQMHARPDTRQHQQLRRAEHPARQHHAARADHSRLPAARIGDAPHALVLEQHALDIGVADHLQIVARRQIGVRGGPALAVLLRHLIQPGPFLPRAVEIVVARDLQRLGRRDERMRAGMREALIADMQWAIVAMPFVRAARVGLAALEHRQHVVPAPAGAAERRPIVVIPAMPANIQHRVDRTRSAQPAPARLVTATAVQPRLRHRLEVPHRAPRLHRDAAGHQGAPARIASARFEHRDAISAALAQAARGGAASRSGADDDDIGFLHALPRSSRAAQRALIVSDVSRLPSWLQPGGPHI